MEAETTFEPVVDSVERLEAATALLERTIANWDERQALLSGEVQRIVATVEQNADASKREQDLERRLAAAELELTELRAQAAEKQAVAVEASSARKTLPAATIQLLEKQGISMLDRVDAGSLDSALAGLSLEQRIAVKSQLIRSGSLS